MKRVHVLDILFLLLIFQPVLGAKVIENMRTEMGMNDNGSISGKLTSDEGKPVDFATVALEGTQYGCFQMLKVSSI